jgi:hypothetical protein
MIKNKLVIFENKIIQRRILHISGSLFVGYYFIPETLLASIDKQWILFGILLLTLSIELYRQNTNHSPKINVLLRNYEHNRPASYFYFVMGSILLLVFFPQYISIPCILSASLCDPLIGEMRRRNNEYVGFSAGFFICFSFFMISWKTSSFWIALIASIIGASSLIYAEYASNSLIDDDLLMQILPATLLFLLTQILLFTSASLPTQLIYPFW